MKSVAEIQNNMAQSIGTTRYIKHSLNRNLVFTDGVNQLRQDADAFWLIDAIASYERKEVFQVWELIVNADKSAVLTMKEDSNTPVLVKQEIPYTDFPLEKIRLFVQDGGYGTAENWVSCSVLMLTSEY